MTVYVEALSLEDVRAQARDEAELRARILRFAEECKNDLESNTEGRGSQYKAGWKAGVEHVAAGLRIGVYNMMDSPEATK
ncbi:hypothetical protein Q0M94_28520 (plasmid) [Deinococcus radiomollis]|uniref:hypothetical protein n=1 Tax=Deinococcus radiomollis TaxID=468916 RepID=UPI003892827A